MSTLETIESLVEKLHLKEVVYYHVGATLREEDTDAARSQDESFTTNFGFRIRHVGSDFGARLRVDIDSNQGAVEVDIALEYASVETLRIPRDVAYAFINEVALMQAFPYIRESVMTLTSRVFRSPLLLPVLLRGSIVFEPDGGPEVSDGTGMPEQAKAPLGHKAD